MKSNTRLIKKNLLLFFFVSLIPLVAKPAWPWTAPWCDCHVTIQAVKEDGTIGGGKVYACYDAQNQTTANCKSANVTVTILGKSHDKGKFPANVYLAAKPDDGYEFDYWECTKKYGTYNNTGTAVGVYKNLAALAAVQKAGVSKMNGSPNNGDDSDVVTSSGDINAIWIAHFKRAEMQTVTVQSENTSLGTANIDKVTNYVDDEVTITAWCGNSGNNPRSESIMFLGWYRFDETTGEKELVSTDNVYTFTITEANKGTYYARFDSGYGFWRIKNDKYDDYLTAVAKYTGTVSVSNIETALSTQMSFNNDLESSISDAGTIFRFFISNQDKTNDEIWDIYVQEEHTNQFYDPTPGTGIFLQLTHQTDNTYFLNAHNNTAFLQETNDGKFSYSTMALASAKWRLEGIDKDLTTKKNYFAVAPEEFVGPDKEGYYWTTLRMCFNMKYETSEITPYIVTAADAGTGIMELKEVTGGIIPEKTCVLLKCKSTYITRNVMIPTVETASFDPDGNLLTSSTYYYTNQSVASSLKLKGIKLVEGRIGFGGTTKTKVDGNRAYLSVDGDVAVSVQATDITLADLCASGEEGELYTISDKLLAVEADETNGIVWCKDLGGNTSINPTSIVDGQTDFMRQEDAETQIAPQVGEWDQSNWVALQFSTPTTSNGIDALVSSAVGKYVKAGTITGTYNDDVNYTLTMATDELQFDGTPETAYVPNVYCPANFVESNLNPTAAATEGNNYFFMNPKVQEVCHITFAMWDGDKFTVLKDSDIPGVLNIDFSHNVLPNPPLVKDKAYQFDAVVSLNTRASMLKEETSGYTVSAINLDGSASNDYNPPTAINTVEIGNGQVKSVKYVNVTGVTSDRPFNGINIVVTEYSDGMVTTAKILK